MGKYRRGKITIEAVNGLKPGEYLLDTIAHGFGVRRQEAGRHYFLRKMVRGRRHFVTIGEHGAGWTPEAARREAQRLYLAIRAGEFDPGAERTKRRQMPTLGAYLEEHIASNPAHNKPATLAAKKASFQHVWGTDLAKRPVDEVVESDIAALHRRMKDLPFAANRLVNYLAAVFAEAERQKLRKPGTNPCAGQRLFRERQRERFLSTTERELFMAALRAAIENGSAPPQAIGCLLLLAATGARKSEILKLEWSDVDLERRMIALADSKTGKKSIFLSGFAVEILQNLPRIDGNPYVIVGERAGGHFVGLQKVWQRLRKAAGLADVRIHDLRHDFASMAAASGASLLEIGALIGHRKVSTTARYAHLAADPLRELNERVGTKIAALDGSRATGEAAAEVVSLEQRRRSGN